MAKKPTGLVDIFKKTEPDEITQPAGSNEPKEKQTSKGVALLPSEWARIEEIAKGMGMNKHKLAAWALRDFLKRYNAGELPIENRPSLPGL